MKIKPEHLEHLEKSINELWERGYDKKALVEMYETGDFPRSDKVKDLQRRFCFDLAFGAGLEKFFSQELYPYMNDDHIFTALKGVCPKVEKRY